MELGPGEFVQTGTLFVHGHSQSNLITPRPVVPSNLLPSLIRFADYITLTDKHSTDIKQKVGQTNKNWARRREGKIRMLAGASTLSSSSSPSWSVSHAIARTHTHFSILVVVVLNRNIITFCPATTKDIEAIYKLQNILNYLQELKLNFCKKKLLKTIKSYFSVEWPAGEKDKNKNTIGARHLPMESIVW